MKVRDVVKILKRCDQDASVYISTGGLCQTCGNFYPVADIHEGEDYVQVFNREAIDMDEDEI